MQRGFSAVEVMVVVAVLGGLLAAGLPGLQHSLASRRVTLAAQAFVRDMAWARSEALMRSQPVGVCASVNGLACDAQGWAQGWLVFVDENGNGVRDGNDTVLRVQSDPGISSMASSTPANDRLQFVFQSQGIAHAAAQSLRVTSGQQQRLVCVSMQGRAALRAVGALTCT